MHCGHLGRHYDYVTGRYSCDVIQVDGEKVRTSNRWAAMADTSAGPITETMLREAFERLERGEA
jgi:hypothetical protein